MTDGTISYEQFGRNFIEHAVTVERVAAAVADVAGDADERSLTLGPADAVKATATTEVVDVRAERLETSPTARFAVEIELRLRLTVSVAGAPHRYKGRVRVGLRLSVLTAAPLVLDIDIEEPSRQDVRVDVSGANLRSRIVQGVGNLDDQVAGVVLGVVRERLASPAAAGVRRIDVLALVDQTW